MSSTPIKTEIEPRIFTIRGLQVMLDRDLAELYGVQTKALNQAVKRNIHRFPSDFLFRLSKLELDDLVTKCDRLRPLKHSSVSSTSVHRTRSRNDCINIKFT